MSKSVVKLRSYARDATIMAFLLSGVVFMFATIYIFNQHDPARVFPYFVMSGGIVLMGVMLPMLLISRMLDGVANYLESRACKRKSG